MTKTKVSARAGAAWTAWSAFPSPAKFQLNYNDAQPALVCAVQVPGGGLNVFANGLVALPTPKGELTNTAPVILFTQELASGPAPTAADWVPWPATPQGYVLWAGAVLGGQLSANPDIGYQAARGPIQLWAMAENGGDLMTALTGTGGQWEPWVPVKPAPPASLSVMWPLYGPNNNSATQNQAVFMSTSINAEPDANQADLPLYMSTTKIEFAFGENQLPWAWTAWEEFSPKFPGTGGVASLAAGVLPEGTMQIFAADTYGALWSIWQNLEQNTPVWETAWSKFPLPGGKALTGLNSGSGDYSGPTLPRYVLATAQDVSGELQLFAIGGGTVWTTWKQSTQVGAPWMAWEEF
jgi:hypothetical protein